MVRLWPSRSNVLDKMRPLIPVQPQHIIDPVIYQFILASNLYFGMDAILRIWYFATNCGRPS